MAADRRPDRAVRAGAALLVAALKLGAPLAAGAGDAAGADSVALARRWIEAGEYARVEPVARRALTRLEQAAAPGDTLGAALDVLVESLWRQGFATRPETRALAERALGLRDTSERGITPAALPALLNLGAVRTQTDDLEGARAVLDRALAASTHWPGPDSLQLALAENERASLALREGDIGLGLEHLRRVMALRERALGRDHPLVAWSLSNLANAHEASGDLVTARALREECVRIRARVLRADHPDRARGLKDLANVLVDMGDFERARWLYEESLRMRERTLGPDHPDVANGLVSIAEIERRSGRLEASLRDARRALGIRARAFDPGNPEIATSLLQVARLLAERGDFRGAADSARRALTIRNAAFGASHPVTALALDGLARVLIAAGTADSAIVLAARAIAAKDAGLGSGHPDVARSWLVRAEALAAVSRCDDAIASSLTCERIARDHLVASSARLSARQALDYEAVRTSGLDLAARLAARPEVSDSSRSDVLDAIVRSRGRLIDGALARFRAERTDDPGLADVLARLAPGRALVSYVRCGGEEFPVARAPEYVAFVVRAGRPEVHVVSLGLARPLERAVAVWRKAAVALPARPGGADSLARAGRRVRRRVWDPVAADLTGVRSVLVVPDGAVGAVSFYALPTDPGRFLVDDGPELELVSTERRLARAPPAARSGERLVAVGGVAFAPGGRTAPAHLPRSRHEVEAIATLWRRLAGAERATVLTGVDATRDRLRASLAGCDVLHVATHGVFDGVGIEPQRDLRSGEPAGALDRTALARSGLLFAPAPGAPPGDPARTALLSAADVARLDLRDTRWVVLSGCETSAGRAFVREGVLGLRSAFESAGARVVVLSLWNVEDRWAERWMLELYRARFERGLGTTAAVREASRRVLAERRRLGLPDAPADWAGFVAYGTDD